jgi:hypothetical protein
MPSDILKTKPQYPIFDDFTKEEFDLLTDAECEMIGENSRTDPETGWIKVITPAMRDAWLLRKNQSANSADKNP